MSEIEFWKIALSELRQVLIVLVPAFLTGLFAYLAGSKSSKTQIQITRENNYFAAKLKLLDHLKSELEKSDATQKSLITSFENLLSEYMTYMGQVMGLELGGSSDDPTMTNVIDKFKEVSVIFIDEFNYVVSVLFVYKKSVLKDLEAHEDLKDVRKEVEAIHFSKIEDYEIEFSDLKNATYELKEELLKIHYAIYLYYQRSIRQVLDDVRQSQHS